jgi:hypothetical protein
MLPGGVYPEAFRDYTPSFILMPPGGVYPEAFRDYTPSFILMPPGGVSLPFAKSCFKVFSSQLPIRTAILANYYLFCQSLRIFALA